MARIRSIKPELWTSEQITDVSPLARLLFIGMFNFCDDAGIHPASAKRLKLEVFPADDILQAQILRMIDELVTVGLLMEYEVDGEQYWQVTGWHHQKIDQPTYKYPRPDGTIPAAAEKRRANRAANTKGARNGEPPAEQSPNTGGEDGEHPSNKRHSDGDCSGGVRRTDDEQSASVRGVFAGCSLTEGRGEEGSGGEGNGEKYSAPVNASRLDNSVEQQTDEGASLPPVASPEKSEPVQADRLGDAPAVAQEKKVTPQTAKKVKPEVFNAVACLVSAGVDEQVVNDWIAHRKKKGATATKTVIEDLTEQAAIAGISLEKAMRECCLRGWQGFKAEWYLRDQPSAAKPQRGGFTTTQERNRAISEANARAFLEDEGVTPFDALASPSHPYTIDME